MAHQVRDLLRGEHFGLGVEGGFELGVIHLGIAGGDDEDGPVLHLKGEGLGDAGGDDPGGLGGQLHGGAGGGELQNLIRQAEGGQIVTNSCNGHGKVPSFYLECMGFGSYFTISKVIWQGGNAGEWERGRRFLRAHGTSLMETGPMTLPE